MENGADPSETDERQASNTDGGGGSAGDQQISHVDEMQTTPTKATQSSPADDDRPQLVAGADRKCLGLIYAIMRSVIKHRRASLCAVSCV